MDARNLNDVLKASVDALIELCDLDENGRITFEEFVRVVRGGEEGFYSTPPMLPGPPLSKKNEKDLAERMERLRTRVRPKRTPPPYLPAPQSKKNNQNLPPARKTVATSTRSCEDDPSFQDILEGMVRSPEFRAEFRYHDKSWDAAITLETLHAMLHRRLKPLVAHMPTAFRPLMHRILYNCRQDDGLVTYKTCIQAV